MRKVVYSMGVSLDGYVAGPAGEIDWSAPDEELHRFHNQQARELGAHLCGRRLYQEMTYWETGAPAPLSGLAPPRTMASCGSSLHSTATPRS